MVVLVEAVAWSDPRGEQLRAAQRVEIDRIYGTPDSEPGPAPTADDITLFVIANDNGMPVACGGLRRIDDEHGEIKRMFVRDEARGSGAALAVLRALENAARELGWTRLVLETGSEQHAAIRFYEREGYTPIALYGHYVGSEISRCYERILAT
ncbi:MAG: family acetyltransferase [Aeromicrobium sp.]|nr:family acetyltransferase [Aeromicrobium sp.]